MKNRKERFDQARSFVLYYGKGHAHKIKHYDIAVVEPSAQTAADIKIMNEMKTLVLGYVTIMELGPFHSMYHLLRDEDFLKVNGKKVYKEMFDTYVLNLESKRWQGLLQHHIGKLLLHEGYDGIFMDTIGDVEAPYLPPVERNIQINQATEIVKNLRRSFPQHLIVQNNGLEQLCLKTAKYIDGVCWENPPFSHKESQEWSHAVLERIVHINKEFGVRALFLQDKNVIKLKPAAGIMAQSIADKHGFLYYEAPDNYLSLV